MPFCPAWTSLNGNLPTSGGWLERNEQQNLCSILTATPWGPSGPGKPVSPSGPLSPCQGEETADVSVGSDKGMTRGLTAQRQLEAAAHRLSWDPWLSTSTGLPLSITNTGWEETVFDRSSVVSFCSTSAASNTATSPQKSGTENPLNRARVYNQAFNRSPVLLWGFCFESCYSVYSQHRSLASSSLKQHRWLIKEGYDG